MRRRWKGWKEIEGEDGEEECVEVRDGRVGKGREKEREEREMEERDGEGIEGRERE